MSKLFKDLAKSANDLLSSKKKYTAGGAKKFSVKTKTANDVTYNAEATLSGDSVEGLVGTTFSLDTGFNVKKLQLNNKGVLTSEIKLDDAADNVQFTLDVKLEPLNASDPKEESKIGAIYTDKDITATLVVSPFEPTSADASICVHNDGFFFGGSAQVKYNSSEEEGNTEGNTVGVSKYDFGVGYATDDSTAALTVTDQLKKYQFSFFNQHSAAMAFAATLGGERSSSSAALEFGGSYNVDSDTTAFGKFTLPNGNTDSATASFNLDSQLNSNTKLGLTSVLPLDFNSAPQFGMNLSFGV